MDFMDQHENILMSPFQYFKPSKASFCFARPHPASHSAPDGFERPSVGTAWSVKQMTPWLKKNMLSFECFCWHLESYGSFNFVSIHFYPKQLNWCIYQQWLLKCPQAKHNRATWQASCGSSWPPSWVVFCLGFWCCLVGKYYCSSNQKHGNMMVFGNPRKSHKLGDILGMLPRNYYIRYPICCFSPSTSYFWTTFRRVFVNLHISIFTSTTS